MRAALAVARQVGADTLVAQVLARGQAAYRSSIWPAPTGRDPLGSLLEAADRLGVSVYAWVNVYTWGRLDVPPADPQHPLIRHPEWVTVDRTGRSVWRYRVGESPEVNALFVDPAMEGVRRTMVETVLEIARRYDVEGIQLDYVRYPSPDLGFHPLALRDFWEREATALASGRSGTAGGGGPQGGSSTRSMATVALPSTPQERQAWDRYRSDQVTKLVREASAARQRDGLAVRLSAAVLPDAQRARREFFQDWPAWLAEGLVDEVHLMSYTADPRQLQRWVRAAVELAGGRPVLAGIGVYQVERGQAGRLVELVRSARDAGAAGVVYFSFESFEGRPDLVEAARTALEAPEPPPSSTLP